MYELVYSSHRAVAQAAGEFLNAKLFTREPEEPSKNKQGVKRSEKHTIDERFWFSSSLRARYVFGLSSSVVGLCDME